MSVVYSVVLLQADNVLSGYLTLVKANTGLILELGGLQTSSV